MPEPEQEPELQATANLSPVSPAPVHTAPALAVPALQDTVDTIDAMVAAALAPNGTAATDGPAVDPNLPTGDDNDDVVDDDSFNEAYGDDHAPADSEPAQVEAQHDDTVDDYAKEFDSPAGSENGGGGDGSQPTGAAETPQNPSNESAVQIPEPVSKASEDPADLSSAGQTTTKPVSQTEGGNEPHASTEAQAQQASETAQDAQSSVSPSAEDSAADIKQLVADLTSQPAETSPTFALQATQQPTETAGPHASSSALPSPSSLPPRPPIPHDTPSYPEQHHPGQPSTSVAGAQAAHSAVSTGPYIPNAVPNVGAAGASLPPHPSPGLVGQSAAHLTQAFQTHAPGYPTERAPEDDYQRKWDQFLADERQYMTEAKWDRFPEGSRIFIGNLSSDKVSKRDVFDMFHRFGRLAQISLKSAYGFVQYHTVDEGRAAVENLEGVEIKGRRIHLEISRVQDKSKKERARSPDKGRGRDRDDRRGSRYGQGRDEFRSSRDMSPRRNDYRGREDQYGRGRNSFDGGRNRRRSRSPGWERHDKDSYRRRSPSPYGRSRGEPELELPKRYGADVPDVQIILEPDVNRDFANWVEMTFKGKGLQTEVMFLHPRMPKEQVIQRQAAEGVHAVVDLDLRAQSLSKVPVQAFDRSAGLNNVRFEQYVDLDPTMAAEVILRAKASGAARYGQQQQHLQQQYGGYGQPYGGHQQPPPGPGYGAPPPHGYSQQAPQQPAGNVADIAALMGQVDPATLQKLIATIQGPPQAGGPPAAAPANGGLDVNAILQQLNVHQPAASQGPRPGQYGAPYGQQPPPQQQPPMNGDAAAQVQNIMAQLARHR